MADNQSQSNTTKSSPAGETLQRFNAWWSYAKRTQHNRWQRNRKLYNNTRVNPSYKGLTDTFVPLTFSTVETIVAALAAGRPSTEFMPNDMYAFIMNYTKTGKKPDLKALNAAYDYYWDCDNWDLKTIKTVRGGLIDGIAGEWLWWDKNKPRVINLKARDIIIDPGLKDPMDLLTDPKNHYAGRRFLTTLSALKTEKIIDPRTGKLIRRYKNLSRVTPGFTGDKESDADRRDMFTGAVGANEDIVEVIEIWDGDTIRSTANRSESFLIEDRPNDVGIIPLALTRFIADEETVVGKSIIDPIADQQELLNDVTNQSVDAVTDILTPRWELDPAYADQIGLVAESSFGTVFPFAPGSLRPIEKPIVTNGAFNERMNIKNEIREATGADQIVQGVRDTGGATATEINAQMSQAGQRFELFVRMLEREAFYLRAKIVYKLMRYYQKQIDLIPVMSMDGPKFHIFDPKQFDESYEPKIQLQSTIDAKKQRDMHDFTQAFQVLIQDPTNDLYEAKKALYPKMFDLDEEQLDKIIGAQKIADPSMGGLPAPDGSTPPPTGQGMPALPQGQQAAAPLPPEPGTVTAPSGIVHQSADLVKLYVATTDPGLRAQIVEALGFTPNPAEEAVEPQANNEPDISAALQSAQPNPPLPTVTHAYTPDAEIPAEDATEQQPEPAGAAL